jgi:hypothetical protein
MSSNVLPINATALANELTKGIVRSLADQAVLLDLDGSIVNATMAFSCLVKPQVDDVVLVSCLGSEFTVLAIMQRSESQQDIQMQIPANLRIDTPNGALNLSANTDLSLHAGQKAQIIAKDAGIISQTVNVNSHTLSSQSSETHIQTGNLRIFADACDSVIGRVTQRAENVMRWVEGVESLSLGSLIQNVRKSFTSRSSQAIITARQDMRIDGERIHMG